MSTIRGGRLTPSERRTSRSPPLKPASVVDPRALRSTYGDRRAHSILTPNLRAYTRESTTTELTDVTRWPFAACPPASDHSILVHWSNGIRVPKSRDLSLSRSLPYPSPSFYSHFPLHIPSLSFRALCPLPTFLGVPRFPSI